MGIDVAGEVLINRAKEDVAAYAMEVENEPAGIGGVVEARMLTEPPLRKGSRVTRVAKFLGRRMEYTNGVVEHEPSARLVMKSVVSPFPMTITYEFEGSGDGTLARIRVHGEASGFFRLAAPVLAGVVRRSITRDLQTLKKTLEPGAA